MVGESLNLLAIEALILLGVVSRVRTVRLAGKAAG